MAQESKQLELTLGGRGEALNAQRSEQAAAAATENGRSGKGALMERVVERSNLQRAWKNVKGNRGSPGVDGMTVGEAPVWLKANWPEVKASLLAGTYRPDAVRRVMIPKPGGGERMLGIPTVLDRLIQQAILQVLQPDFDATFSEDSYGFRPGRSAHDAMRRVQHHVEGGKRWVVDIDLEKFFDRVNHDILMGRLAKRIEDRRLLRLIRRYLCAGVMVDGVVEVRRQGTPQGGPLSPLLANVLLDEVDKELERRGHAFVRYADDLRVFVGTERSGQRVMRSLTKLFAKLKLTVNESKSAVDRAQYRPFLGFGLWYGRGGKVNLRVAPKALQKMKHRVRRLTGRTRGRSLSQVIAKLRTYLLGWRGYFRISDTGYVFHNLDRWIRRRLRAYIMKQWKRGTTAYKALRARGLNHRTAAIGAAHTRQWWRASLSSIRAAYPNKFFARRGLPRLGP